MKNINRAAVAPTDPADEWGQNVSRTCLTFQGYNNQQTKQEVISEDEDPDSDNGDGIVYERDASNGLSHQKLQYVINHVHPRSERVNEDTKNVVREPLPCCGTKTGMFSCFKKLGKSDLHSYGTGVVAYFQFLKYLIFMFTVMIILSGPSLCFYFSGNKSVVKDFRSLIVSFSLGNIGASEPACNYARYDLQGTTTTAQTVFSSSIYLSCSYGTLQNITAFGQISANDQINCNSVNTVAKVTEAVTFYPQTCEWSNWNSTQKAQLLSTFQASCYGKATCTLSFQQSQLPSSLCTVTQTTAANWQYLLQASCTSQTITVGKYSWQLSKSDASIAIVMLDLVLIYLIWFALIMVKPMEKQSSELIETGALTASDFTVMIKQMPYKDHLLQLPAVYWAWAENILEKESDQYFDQATGQQDLYQNLVLTVNLGLSNYGFLKHMQDMGKLLYKKKLESAKKIKISDEAEKKKIQLKIDKLQEQAIAKLKKVEQYKETHHSEAIYSFITFQSMNGKKKFLKALKISRCQRCVLRCKGRKNEIEHKYLGKHWPQVSDAVDPSLILWQNLGVSRFSQIVRQIIIYFICFILVCGAFLAIGLGMKYNDEQAKTQWNPSKCGTIPATQEAAYVDLLRAESLRTGVLSCYCYQQFTKVGVTVTQTMMPNGAKPCGDWLSTYSKQQGVGYSISIAIALTNYILKEFILAVTDLEAHHTKTQKEASTTSKIWIVQFFATSIILTLINANWSNVITLPPTFPILQGTYQDFTARWYSQIGATIATTIFINIVMPILNLFDLLIANCSRCCDRGCRFDKRRTKRFLQADYESVYTGDELQFTVRYALIIATWYMIMIYSLAIPFLYFAGLCIFISMYWTDKCLFVKFYKTPPRYGTEITRRVFVLLEFGIIMHFMVGIYMISNPDTFSSSSQPTLDKGVAWAKPFAVAFGNWMQSWFGVSSSRFQQTHSVIYLIGCFIWLCIFVLEHTLRIVSIPVGLALKLINRNVEEAENFSVNLLNEIEVEALHSQYTQTQQDMAKVNQNSTEEALQNSQALFQYYLLQLEFRLKRIKVQLNAAANALTSANPLKKQTTEAQFSALAKSNKMSSKMNGLISYDILDHPDYISAKKIETRIVRYYEAVKAHQAAGPNA